MKKLDLSQMENIEGGLTSCQKTIMSGSRDFTASDACIICAGLGGAAAGAILGPGALAGWAGGLIGGLFTC